MGSRRAELSPEGALSYLGDQAPSKPHCCCCAVLLPAPGMSFPGNGKLEPAIEAVINRHTRCEEGKCFNVLLNEVCSANTQARGEGGDAPPALGIDEGEATSAHPLPFLGLWPVQEHPC